MSQLRTDAELMAVASEPLTTTIEGGTEVTHWFDGRYWRARVDRPGVGYVRVDTVEQLLVRIPARHTRIRARVRGDVVVFETCTKPAEFLGVFARMFK